MALTHIPKVMEYASPDAPYNKLIVHLDQRFPDTITYEFVPSSRSNKLLNTKQVDCLFPIIPIQSREVETQLSEPINGISAHIFSLGPEVYTDITQLNDKLIVYLRGYLFGGIISRHSKLHFFAVSNQEAALGMLEKQRAHAYIDYIPDIRFVFNPAQLAKLKYSEQHPIFKEFDRLECLKTKTNLAFLNKVNQEIDTLRSSGKLKKMLGKYYVSVD